MSGDCRLLFDSIREVSCSSMHPEYPGGVRVVGVSDYSFCEGVRTLYPSRDSPSICLVFLSCCLPRQKACRRSRPSSCVTFGVTVYYSNRRLCLLLSTVSTVVSFDGVSRLTDDKAEDPDNLQTTVATRPDCCQYNMALHITPLA